MQQLRQQVSPDRSEAQQQKGAYENALKALTQTPRTRLQELTFAILEGVNQRNWFGVDVLLRQYAHIPQHDPSLFTFVSASRSAAEGDYATAITDYREMLRSNPLFTRGTLDLARILFTDNRLRDAHEVFLSLQARELPIEIHRHIDEYLKAIDQRTRWQLNLSVAMIYENNLNNASTVVDPCALIFMGTCLPNLPGEKKSGEGINVEASINRLWPLSGHHGLMLRSINYGNHYRREDDYDNLVSTTYLGYQFSSAHYQLQALPLLEYQNEGGRKIYHALGLRTSFRQQLNRRSQLEASYEFKDRHFSSRLESLQGNLHSLSLFGNYVLYPNVLLYGNVAWRSSEARQAMFAYQEKTARLGIYKSFADAVLVNVSYGYRQKEADAINAIFGKRQRDHENSLYLHISLPRYRWHGLTPTLGYEYRNNRSNIAHVYSHEKNRLTLGFNKNF